MRLAHADSLLWSGAARRVDLRMRIGASAAPCAFPMMVLWKLVLGGGLVVGRAASEVGQARGVVRESRTGRIVQ